MPLVIVGVTRVRALKEPMSAEHIDQNLQPFTGNKEVSEWVKISPVWRKTPSKQTEKISSV